MTVSKNIKNALNVLLGLFLLSLSTYYMYQDILKGELLWGFFLWFPISVSNTLHLIKDFFNLDKK
jgi:hypothetical protein